MIDNLPIYHKNRLIQIFQDHWGEFKRFHPDIVDDNIETNVQKMMGCGMFSNGYAEYRCSCGYVKKVPFSCKSRFCLRCSKVYIDNWVAKMKQTIFAKVNHRHIILTVPGSLWKYFHNPKTLKLLADCGAELVQEVCHICLKGKQIELGIILVTQTAGRKSTWNPHLHLLVTEGGLDKNNRWRDFYYFDYEILRKKWMYIILTSLKDALKDDPCALRLIDECFQKRSSSGFIAGAKKEKVRKTDIIGYLIKYVASPPIALSRITGYDGRYVKYWYREHPTDRQISIKVSAYEFIANLIQHISPKGLKLIRHYGLYARCKFKKVKEMDSESQLSSQADSYIRDMQQAMKRSEERMLLVKMEEARRAKAEMEREAALNRVELARKEKQKELSGPKRFTLLAMLRLELQPSLVKYVQKYF